MIARIAFGLGLLLAFPVAVATAIGLQIDLSWPGRLLLGGLCCGELGLLLIPWRDRLRLQHSLRILAALGSSVLIAAVGAHGLAAGTGGRLLLFPAGTDQRWLGWVPRERDLVLAGARVVREGGQLPPAELAGLEAALAEAYRELEAAAGPLPSPYVVGNLLPLTPGAWPALVIEPAGNPATPPQSAVLFLHGFAGNFTWPCWAIAQAAAEIRGVTICPSQGIAGDWWTPAGEARIRQVLDWLGQRGIRRVYLAGLSNGAVGASLLAKRLAPRLCGLLLLSGAAPLGGTGGLPTLVLQGRDDQLMPATLARELRRLPGVRYLELPGNHFLLLHDRRQVLPILGNWLREQEQKKRACQGRGGS